MYYNPTTKEIKSRYDVEKLYPYISLPKEFEQCDNWFKLYEGTRPTADENQRVVQGDIELVDYKYTQTYKVESLSDEQILANNKHKRNREVNNITVTVDNMVFDGNETAQGRIARTILAKKEGSVKWVLADNTIADVTIEQLEKVLEFASEKMSELWVKVYE